MRTHNWKHAGRGRIAFAVCLAAAALALGGCESNGDPTAPADSTLTVSADPQTVIIGSGGGTNTSTITATLRSKTGARLPGQEITFSTSEGSLDPPAQTPLTTDNQGQAVSILDTGGVATVTAQSGSITGSTQVQTSPCVISTILLNVTPQDLGSCSDELEVKAEVLDNQSGPCIGVRVSFTNPMSTVMGSFTPQQKVTDDFGVANSKWQPIPGDCEAQCGSNPTDPNSGTCTIFIGASVGSISATAVEIFDATP